MQCSKWMQLDDQSIPFWIFDTKSSQVSGYYCVLQRQHVGFPIRCQGMLQSLSVSTWFEWFKVVALTFISLMNISIENRKWMPDKLTLNLIKQMAKFGSKFKKKKIDFKIGLLCELPLYVLTECGNHFVFPLIKNDAEKSSL